MRGNSAGIRREGGGTCCHPQEGRGRCLCLLHSARTGGNAQSRGDHPHAQHSARGDCPSRDLLDTYYPRDNLPNNLAATGQVLMASIETIANCRGNCCHLWIVHLMVLVI